MSLRQTRGRTLSPGVFGLGSGDQGSHWDSRSPGPSEQVRSSALRLYHLRPCSRGPHLPVPKEHMLSPSSWAWVQIQLRASGRAAWLPAVLRGKGRVLPGPLLTPPAPFGFWYIFPSGLRSLLEVNHSVRQRRHSGLCQAPVHMLPLALTGRVSLGAVSVT